LSVGLQAFVLSPGFYAILNMKNLAGGGSNLKSPCLASCPSVAKKKKRNL
jgi:hypothetical protein